MSYEEEETFDKVNLRLALRKLLTEKELEIIKASVARIIGPHIDVSLTYPTTGGWPAYIGFVLHCPDKNLRYNQTGALTTEISKELSYSNILVLAQDVFERALDRGKYAPCELISPENLEKIKEFHRNYSSYIGFQSEERPRSQSPVAFWQEERTENRFSTPSSNDASPTKRGKHDSKEEKRTSWSGSSGETSPKKNN